MADDVSALIAIAIMMLVTYATRIGGVLAMSVVRMTPRKEAFLRQLGASVLIAIIVPEAAEGGAVACLAVLTAALVVLATRSPLAGMTAGVTAAATARALSGAV